MPSPPTASCMSK
uniref:Uncharacterized protein n=1 Tax=Anguilla anguilla TaxID=7936 RepID=A0A0E9TQT5_ANGAN